VSHTSSAAFATDAASKWRVYQGISAGSTIVFGDGVNDNSAAVSAANALGSPILFSGISIIGTPTTITVPIVDTMSQIFTAASQVTLNNGLPVRPEWWGSGQNTIRYAINALPVTGGVVQLEDKTYQPNGFVYGFGGPGVYVSKNSVKIQGRKMPRLSDTCASLVGGSVIQGMFLAYAHAFEMTDCGVDCGIDVVTAFYGGTTAAGITEGLTITYPDDATKASSSARRGVRLHNVIGLCKDPAAPNHAVIAGEGVTEVVCTGEIVGCFGIHGVVFKCAGVRAATITAYCNNAEGVIIKSDAQSTAVANDVMIDKVYSRAQGPIGFAPHTSALGTQAYGVMIHASANAVDKVQISVVRSDGAKIGIGNVFGGSFTSSSVKIQEALIDQMGVAGIRQGLQLLGSTSQSIMRWNIGHLECRNTSVGAQFVFDQTAALNQHCHIEHLHVVNAANAVDIGGNSRVSIGTVTTDTLTGGVYHITGAPKLLVGILFQDAQTPVTYDASSGGLVPALANGWSQVAGNDAFGIDLLGGRVGLRGLIKPGTGVLVATLPAWARPLSNKRFVAQAFNGSAQIAVPVVVDTSGNVTVNEAAGGVANCSSWLSLSGINYDTQA